MDSRIFLEILLLPALSLPTLLLSIAALFGTRLPNRSFFCGFGCGVLSAVISCLALYWQWGDPSHFGYGRPALPTVVLPAVVVVLSVLAGARRLGLPYSRPAFLCGCACALAAWLTTTLMLYSYVDG